MATIMQIIGAAQDKTLLEINKNYRTSFSIKDTVKEDFIVQPTSLKAVGQKPTAGTLIATGSKVVVYFEDTNSMSIDIIEGAHAGYTGKSAKEVVDLAEANEAVNKILADKETKEDLTPEEEVTMNTFFMHTLGLEIDTNDPTKNTKAAYDALSAVYFLMQ